MSTIDINDIVFEEQPYHEVLVDIIRAFDGRTVTVLWSVLKRAKIPKGHDEIVKAIEQAMEEYPLYAEKFEGMKMDVLNQKAEAEMRKTEKTKRSDDKDRRITALLGFIEEMHQCFVSPHGGESKRAQMSEIMERLNQSK